MASLLAQMINNSHVGFAIHEVIYDEALNPIDYRFLELNNAYLEITGLDTSIIGRTLLEVSTVIANDPIRWVQLFGNMATNMTSANFEYYSPLLKNGMW